MEARTRTERRTEIERDVDQQLQALANDINQAATKDDPGELSPVERIANELAGSFGAAGQELLTKAQNIVHDDEAFIDHIRAEIRRRVDIHTQFMHELQECDRDHKNARAKLQAK